MAAHCNGAFDVVVIGTDDGRIGVVYDASAREKYQYTEENGDLRYNYMLLLLDRFLLGGRLLPGPVPDPVRLNCDMPVPRSSGNPLVVVGWGT